jgi:hypothetical protein
MSYDEKCYQLAKDFLEDAGQDTEANCHALAQLIQGSIEDFVAAIEATETTK